jgi:hypothetical protein
VDVGRPSACRHPALPQSSNCVVQGVRHSSKIESAILEDARVHALGDERSVDVVHRPIGHVSVEEELRLLRDLPESGDDALEPDIEHGGGNVDGLVWLVRIHRCRLASTEIGELAVWDMDAHQVT